MRDRRNYDDRGDGRDRRSESGSDSYRDQQESRGRSFRPEQRDMPERWNDRDHNWDSVGGARYGGPNADNRNVGRSDTDNREQWDRGGLARGERDWNVRNNDRRQQGEHYSLDFNRNQESYEDYDRRRDHSDRNSSRASGAERGYSERDRRWGSDIHRNDIRQSDRGYRTAGRGEYDGDGYDDRRTVEETYYHPGGQDRDNYRSLRNEAYAGDTYGPQYGRNGAEHGSDEGRSMRDAWGTRGEHRGKGPKGYTRTDDRIRERLCETLSEEGSLDASEIEVAVKDAEVTLSGSVTSNWDKRLAEQLAERSPGVKEVHNEITIMTEGGSRDHIGEASADTGASGLPATAGDGTALKEQLANNNGTNSGQTGNRGRTSRIS